MRLSRTSVAAVINSRLFRAAVSIALIALLMATTDLGELARVLSRVNVGLLTLAVLLFLATNMVSVLKWRKIIIAQGAYVSWPSLVSIFYMGLFFNNFLPTNFGGDVVRVLKLSNHTGSRVEAASSVVMDRATSIFALLLIAVAAALTRLRYLDTRLALLIVGMFIAFILIAGVFASERAARRLARIPFLSGDPFGARRHLRNFYLSVNQFRNEKRTLAAVVLLSIVYQGMFVLVVNLIALSLDIRLPVVYYFLFIPVIMAVGMIPFSLNGLGVREGAWVILFVQAGVPRAEALSMSVLSFLVITLVSMLGGVFYLFDQSLPQGDTVVGE